MNVPDTAIEDYNDVGDGMPYLQHYACTIQVTALP